MWVDSVLTHMTTAEKAGQLILFRSQLTDECTEASMHQWAEKGQFGGLMLEDLDLLSYLDLTDRLRKLTDIPLFMGSSEQVLLNEQFNDLSSFPNSAALSAIASDSLKNVLLQLYFKQAYQLGINFTLGNDLTDPAAPKPYGSQLVSKGNNHHLLGFAGGIRLMDLLADRDSSCQLDPLLAPYHQVVEDGVSGFWIDAHQLVADSLHQFPKFFLKQHFRSDLDFKGLDHGRSGGGAYR